MKVWINDMIDCHHFYCCVRENWKLSPIITILGHTDSKNCLNHLQIKDKRGQVKEAKKQLKEAKANFKAAKNQKNKM